MIRGFRAVFCQAEPFPHLEDSMEEAVEPLPDARC